MAEELEGRKHILVNLPDPKGGPAFAVWTQPHRIFQRVNGSYYTLTYAGRRMDVEPVPDTSDKLFRVSPP